MRICRMLKFFRKHSEDFTLISFMNCFRFKFGSQQLLNRIGSKNHQMCWGSRKSLLPLNSHNLINKSPQTRNFLSNEPLPTERQSKVVPLSEENHQKERRMPGLPANIASSWASHRNTDCWTTRPAAYCYNFHSSELSTAINQMQRSGRAAWRDRARPGVARAYSFRAIILVLSCFLCSPFRLHADFKSIISATAGGSGDLFQRWRTDGGSSQL